MLLAWICVAHAAIDEATALAHDDVPSNRERPKATEDDARCSYRGGRKPSVRRSVLTPERLTRSLIDQERARAGESASEDVVVRSACEHLFEHLSLWMGVGGSHALFARALLGTQSSHPALATIRVRADAAEARLDDVEEALRETGPAATTEALAALMEATLSLLERFVGGDLVASLAGLRASGRGPEEGATHRRPRRDP